MDLHMDPKESADYCKAAYDAIRKAAEKYERPNMSCMLFAMTLIQARFISSLSDNLRERVLSECINMLFFNVEACVEDGDSGIVVREHHLN